MDWQNRFWRNRGRRAWSRQLFDGVDPNPVEKNVLDGLEAYRRGNCDGVIGLGGGSPLDVAKAIRLVVTHPVSAGAIRRSIGWRGENHAPTFRP